MVEEGSQSNAILSVEDPGKASELILKFNAPKPSSEKLKEKREVKKFSEDRLNFLNKNASQSKEQSKREVGRFSEDRLKFLEKKTGDTGVEKAKVAPKKISDDRLDVFKSKNVDESPLPMDGADNRGLKPGGGDSKWLRNITNSENDRKKAADEAAKKGTDARVIKLQAELESAGLECTERARLLTTLREKHSYITRQLTDMQDLLGIANSVKNDLLHNAKKSRKDEESEEDLKEREAREKEELKRQAIEMRDKLSNLMKSEKEKDVLQKEFESLKVEYETKEAETLSEVERLTSVVVDLNDKMRAKDAEWETTEKEMAELKELLKSHEASSELMKSQDDAMAKLKIEFEVVTDELVAMKLAAEETETNLRAEIEAATNQAAEARETLQKENQAAASLTTSLEESLTAEKTQAAILTSNIDEQKKEHATILDQLDAVRNELSEARAELDRKQEEYEAALMQATENHAVELDDKDAFCCDLTKELHVSNEQIEALREDNKTAKKELTEKDDALSSLKEDCESKGQTSADLECQLGTANDTLSSLRNEASAIQVEIERSIKEVAELQATEETLKATLRSMEEAAVMNEATQLELRGELASATARANLLAEEVETIQKEADAKRAEALSESERRLQELGALKEESIVLEGLVKESAAQTKESEDRVKESEAKIDALTTSLASSNQRMADSEAASESFEKEKKEIQEEAAAKEAAAAAREEALSRQLEEAHATFKIQTETILAQNDAKIASLTEETSRRLSEGEAALVERVKAAVKTHVEAAIGRTRGVMSRGPTERNEWNVVYLSERPPSVEPSPLILPPDVTAVDDEDLASERGPSLKDYVEALNRYKSKMNARDEKFIKRLDKFRELEASLGVREQQVNDRIEKVSVKEKALVDVIKAMKDRETELRNVSASFENFRARLVNSTHLDTETNAILNKTLEPEDMCVVSIKPRNHDSPARASPSSMLTEMIPQNETRLSPGKMNKWTKSESEVTFSISTDDLKHATRPFSLEESHSRSHSRPSSRSCRPRSGCMSNRVRRILRRPRTIDYESSD